METDFFGAGLTGRRVFWPTGQPDSHERYGQVWVPARSCAARMCDAALGERLAESIVDGMDEVMFRELVDSLVEGAPGPEDMWSDGGYSS